jgi:hypothetical protein
MAEFVGSVRGENEGVLRTLLDADKRIGITVKNTAVRFA